MEIISSQFFYFIAIVLFLYYLLPHKLRNPLLLIASYIFYSSFGIYFVLVLLFTSLVNFWLGLKIGSTDSRIISRYWFILSLLINLLALVFFKLASSSYSDFLFRFLEQGNWLKKGFTAQVLLPVGFAFYCLQSISYLIDVYNKKMLPVDNLIEFALYLAYFPKLTSGPIERAKQFLPKLSQANVITPSVVTRNLTLIFIGLIRKIIIADWLTKIIFVNYIWAGINSPYSSIELSLWLIAYAFALYNDFAGYTSIVRGISGLFGIELSPNFQQPFFSQSFTEFWNRWHISLSHWLRDYTYFPLSRFLVSQNQNRRNLFNMTIPSVVTMLISGLWHNFGAYMLVWGGMHAVYQVCEQLLIWLRLFTLPEKKPKWQQISSAMFVFLFTTIVWVPFALKTMQGNAGALSFWQALFISPHGGIQDVWTFAIIIPCAISLGMDWAQYHSKKETIFLDWPLIPRSFVFASALILLLSFSLSNNVQNFVYQGF